MLRKFLKASALGTVALASAALSQTVTPPEGSKPVARGEVNIQARMSMHVNALVLEDLKQFVPDDEARGKMLLRMVLLAKQEAIAASCAGYDLDQQRMFTMMFRTTMPLLDEKIEQNVRTANFNRALRKYNTVLGGELAQFAYDPNSYCDYAKTLFAELDGESDADSILVLKRS